MRLKFRTGMLQINADRCFQALCGTVPAAMEGVIILCPHSREFARMQDAGVC